MRLVDGSRSLPIGVIVTDLDRTLTDARLRVVPGALAALGAARRAGVRTVLATGRTIGEIRERSGLLGAFDALVLEGGGLTGTRDHLVRASVPIGLLDDLQTWLVARGIPFRRGASSISVAKRELERVRRFPAFRRLAPHLNRDRVDVTMRGITKGTGLRSAVRGLGRRGRILAFGDGENDVDLFDAAHYGVAVANAVPKLRRRADDVTRYPGGRGVADFIRRRLLGGRRK